MVTSYLVRLNSPVMTNSSRFCAFFLAMVNLARHLGVDAEAALRHANRRFEDRFRLMETAAEREGSHLGEESLERLEERWQTAKRELADSASAPD